MQDILKDVDLKDYYFDNQWIEIEKRQRKTLTEMLYRQLSEGCPREITDMAILNMFSPEFQVKIKYLPINKNIFEVLRRNGDVFKLLEQLANIIECQHNDLLAKSHR